MSQQRKRPAVVPEVVSPIAPIPALLHDISTTAKLMSTTTWAVRELCRSGRLKFVHVGHRWLVSTHAIEQFITQAEREAQACE
jgi:excisionase family DNA binding protein